MGQMNRHVAEHRTRDTRGVKRIFSRLYRDVNSHFIFTKTKLHGDELCAQCDPYCKFISHTHNVSILISMKRRMQYIISGTT
jgi:hypothetical protein